MTALAGSPQIAFETVSDLLERLGDIPPERVLMHPQPGTATLQDLIDRQDRGHRLCELVDGVLVEKTVGVRESALAVLIAAVLRAFVVPRNLGIVLGSDGMLQLMPGLVRGPDVCYIAWDRLPGGTFPIAPVPDVAPNLAVEVLSKSNTRKEMNRKRREYFEVGVQLVWIVDPVSRTVAVYTSATSFVTLDESQTLDGAAALPGFSLPIRDIFSELDRKATS